MQLLLQIVPPQNTGVYFNGLCLSSPWSSEVRTWTLIFLLAALLGPKVQKVWWVSNPSAAYQLHWAVLGVFSCSPCSSFQKHALLYRSMIQKLSPFQCILFSCIQLWHPFPFYIHQGFACQGDHNYNTLEKMLGCFVQLNVKINGCSPKKHWVGRSGVKRKRFTCSLVCDFES